MRFYAMLTDKFVTEEPDWTTSFINVDEIIAVAKLDEQCVRITLSGGVYLIAQIEFAKLADILVERESKLHKLSEL